MKLLYRAVSSWQHGKRVVTVLQHLLALHLSHLHLLGLLCEWKQDIHLQCCQSIIFINIHLIFSVENNNTAQEIRTSQCLRQLGVLWYYLSITAVLRFPDELKPAQTILHKDTQGIWRVSLSFCWTARLPPFVKKLLLGRVSAATKSCDELKLLVTYIFTVVVGSDPPHCNHDENQYNPIFYLSRNKNQRTDGRWWTKKNSKVGALR